MLKKTHFFCLVLILFASQAIAQSGKTTSMQLTNVTLKEFFKEVESKEGYSFMYSNIDIDDSKKITVSAKSASINQILDEAFKGLPINYEITANNKIVLKKAKAIAQNESTRKVTGVVIDNLGDPIIGAAVMIKGTKTGSTTDVDGNFTVDISGNNAVLSIQYLGYHSQEVLVGQSSSLEIKLLESDQALEEVVVIGYGTMKKRDLTAAITSVESDKISTKAATNPAEALQGVVSGVSVLKSSGLAGSEVSIKIRGINTFGSNEPLYIIDGFYGDINNLNPNDIESIDILKDGAASAIYGSIAANGVVIVTTKSGKEGKVVVDLNSYASMRKIAKRVELLDGEGYVAVHEQMYENAGRALPSYVLNPGVRGQEPYNTNWQDEVFRTGVSLNQSVSVRGGLKDTKFALSANVTDDKGILINNDFTKQNVRAKISTKKNIFTIDGNMGFRASKQSKPYIPLMDTYMISPLVPVYDKEAEGGYGLTNLWKDMASNINPIANTENRTGWQKRQHFDGSFSVGVDIMEGLNFKTSYGYRGNNYQDYEHYRKFTADPKSPVQYPFYEEQRGYWEEQTFDNVLSYNKEVNEHTFNFMIGTSMNKEQSSWSQVGVEGKTTIYSVSNGKLVHTEEPAGFPNQDFMTINAGKGGTFSGSGTKYRYNRMSYFGRLNYNFGSRYLFQFSMRRDGSSKFESKNRWGTFPSFAAGWRINNESFFPQVDAISNLKLRASWGKLGNEVALGYYDSYSRMSTSNTLWLGSVQGSGSNPWLGTIAPGLEDKDLKWETTESINIGFDFGFFNNKLNGTINYYNNTTRDLLIAKPLSVSSGLATPILNVGKMRNQGVEFDINYADKTGEVSYNIGMNLSYLKNEVVRMADATQFYEGTGLNRGDAHFVNRTQQGQPVGAYFLYTTDGIFQSEQEVKAHVDRKGNPLQPYAKPGDIRFKDVNGDGVIDDNDKTFMGSGMPKVEANMNLGASYKGFDFSAIIGSGWGHKLYNGNRFYFEGMASGSNFMATTLNAWTVENPNTSMPRAVLGDPNDNRRESDRFLEKGDFIRLRQVQLGYTLPPHVLKMLRMDNLRFYISGENLATWTKYDGTDPEFATSILNTGLDRFVFPFTRSYTFGMQLTF